MSRDSSLFPPLVVLGTTAVVLWMGRVGASGSWAFLFLPLNLGLAVIPFLLGASIAKLSGPHPWAAVALAPLWLLFLPNAQYLTTDLIHLAPRHTAPLWYDALMLVTFAAAGAVSGLGAIEQVHRALVPRIGAVASGAVMLSTSALCGFGLYLGRVGRWNSWDALVQPGALLSAVIDQVTHPRAHAAAWAFTLVHALWSVALVVAWAVYVGDVDGAPARTPRLERKT
jgi:uncharacterized membrane protein